MSNSQKHKKNKNQADEAMLQDLNILDDDSIVVEMTDEDGNVFLYEQEMIIPIEDKNFALLVALPFENDETAHKNGCDCGCEDADVIIAKVITNDDGEEEYIEPTDEEFEMAQDAYNKFFDEEEWAQE